jgi:hypothetical protein
LGLTEVNLHWKLLEAKHRIHERVRGWFRSTHISYSYYENLPNPRKYQPGGTVILSRNEAADRVMGAGKDAELGRWSWTQYRGKRNISVKVYTVYHPVENKHDEYSAYQQQLDFFYEQGREVDPRKVLIDELCVELKAVLDKGEQVVVILDANEDIRRGYAQEQFEKIGLVEAIIDRHGDAPPTYDRGSKPIDGIFVSPTLRGCRCGYEAFGDGPPGITHRLIWIDIPVVNAFGNVLTSTKFKARRLKNFDPRVTERYLATYKKFIKEHKLDERVDNLKARIHNEGLTDEAIAEWHEIDAIR